MTSAFIAQRVYEAGKESVAPAPAREALGRAVYDGVLGRHGLAPPWGTAGPTTRRVCTETGERLYSMGRSSREAEVAELREAYKARGEVLADYAGKLDESDAEVARLRDDKASLEGRLASATRHVAGLEESATVAERLNRHNCSAAGQLVEEKAETQKRLDAAVIRIEELEEQLLAVRRRAVSELQREFLERTPAGTRWCYLTPDRVLFVTGSPDEEGHNCDAMGCGQEHVVEQIKLEQLKPAPAEDRRCDTCKHWDVVPIGSPPCGQGVCNDHSHWQKR